MKSKDMYVGQKVASTRDPKSLLGEVTALKKHDAVEVQTATGQVVTYGAKALVGYKE